MPDTDPYPQRNPGDVPVDVPAIPATVGAGEVVDWHLPIAGFQPVLLTPTPDPVPESPAQPKARAAAPEGVTDGSARA